MELRLTAARQRTSVNALIRGKLGIRKKVTSKAEFWKKLDSFAKHLAQKYPHTDLSAKLIETRYEQ
ncbi:MAG: hypothetical protein A3A32_02825 [Candidatus Wildermuthbacteria bacterium RIFCSPLOWO2_01_FULL_48_35]|uniref:Uncharacterized protein n=1 Tax=Candidatus Wildermuthbacteria bacterium RIFCSPLOWO2_01_FULL_48_35 TaxID=1802463 RepID=A0A1G2RRZ5_9BACT|nr:MAG: hypothetical protein A3A32_02825 [Candidatus Wildermuthbacteria bacterium RIFCSPLOWO2_01_FULL_48_35]